MWTTARRHRARTHVHRVEVRLDTLQQFFNSMDPSPFYEKDLDPEAEQYIVSWTDEYPLDEPVRLVLRFSREKVDEATKHMVTEAVHNHFRNLARLSRLDFRRLMRQGWRSLLIGLGVLALCLLVSELFSGEDGTLALFMKQSLLIGGWVAMWRPLQTYLYDWWPLRRRQRVFEKMSRMEVEVRTEA